MDSVCRPDRPAQRRTWRCAARETKPMLPYWQHSGARPASKCAKRTQNLPKWRLIAADGGPRRWRNKANGLRRVVWKAAERTQAVGRGIRKPRERTHGVSTATPRPPERTDGSRGGKDCIDRRNYVIAGLQREGREPAKQSHDYRGGMDRYDWRNCADPWWQSFVSREPGAFRSIGWAVWRHPCPTSPSDRMAMLEERTGGRERGRPAGSVGTRGAGPGPAVAAVLVPARRPWREARQAWRTDLCGPSSWKARGM